jgi:hypothetical protein
MYSVSPSSWDVDHMETRRDGGDLVDARDLLTWDWTGGFVELESRLNLNIRRINANNIRIWLRYTAIRPRLSFLKKDAIRQWRSEIAGIWRTEGS